MRYFGWFEDKNREQVLQSFALQPEEREGINILIAIYGSDGSYGGMAFVLFEKEGTLYEVNAEHCSCYGLEGQWNPEATTHEDLSYRLKKGTYFSVYYDDDFIAELRSIIGE